MNLRPRTPCFTFHSNAVSRNIRTSFPWQPLFFFSEFSSSKEFLKSQSMRYKGKRGYGKTSHYSKIYADRWCNDIQRERKKINNWIKKYDVSFNTSSLVLSGRYTAENDYFDLLLFFFLLRCLLSHPRLHCLPFLLFFHFRCFLFIFPYRRLFIFFAIPKFLLYFHLFLFLLLRLHCLLFLLYYRLLLLLLLLVVFQFFIIPNLSFYFIIIPISSPFYYSYQPYTYSQSNSQSKTPAWPDEAVSDNHRICIIVVNCPDETAMRYGLKKKTKKQ